MEGKGKHFINFHSLSSRSRIKKHDMRVINYSMVESLEARSRDDTENAIGRNLRGQSHVAKSYSGRNGINVDAGSCYSGL
ncbi:hypothetical protein TorRG33x02_247660 [Trema orientale]|uniref:Uncharacterized protein n=1 Tax=Trema orientale TaxID=63057 RepID=A0A2P5DLL5_TREOI|nr:hypothetical protein TorRG33x02_247660 [Trema orientale]